MIYNESNLAELTNKYSIFECKSDASLIKSIIDVIIENEFNLEKDNEKKSLIFNLLYLKSVTIFNIYCLIKKSKEHAININIPGIKEYMQPLLFNNSKIQESNKEISLFDSETNLKLLVRHLINLVFRIHFFITSKKRRNYLQCIKTWCDVDLDLHEDKIHNDESYILIFPFAANIKRGLKHIKYVSKNFKGKFSLIGLPYKLSTLFEIMISKGIKRDILIVDYEYKAAINHSKDFNWCENIYTSEEFLANNFIVNKFLIDKKHYIFNIAHGLGLYSPYSLFTKFKTLNHHQIRFYSFFNKNISYEKIHKTLPKVSIEKKQLNNHALVFIHQNFEDHPDKVYEYNYQNEILNIMNKNPLNFNIQIKFHPNTKQITKDKLLKKYNNFEIYTDLKNPIIFFGTMSSSYFEFSKFGHYILVGENKELLKSIFGENIFSLSISELNQWVCIR